MKHQNASASSSRAAKRGARRSVIPGGRVGDREVGDGKLSIIILSKKGVLTFNALKTIDYVFGERY